MNRITPFALVLVMASLWLTSCQQAMRPPFSTATAITRPSVAHNNPPSPASSHTVAPTLSQASSPTPTATYPPITPATSGEQIPPVSGAITVANASRLALFARWGQGFGHIRQVAFTGDGRYLLIASSVGIHFYDAAKYKLVKSIETPAEIHSLAISPDNETLAATTADGLHFFDMTGAAQARTLATGVSGGVAFSPDGRLLAVARAGEFGEFIEVWDAQLEVALQAFEETDDYINAVTFSPNGQLIATAGNTTKLWSIEGDLLSSNGPYVSGGSTNSLSFSPDGKRLAEGTDLDVVHLWGISGGGQLAGLNSLGAAYDNSSIGQVAFSPDGAWLVAGTMSGLIVYDAHTWEQASRLETSFDTYNGVAAWSPDSRTLAFVGSDLEVKLWRPFDDLEIIVSDGLAGDIAALAWSPTGAEITVGGGSGVAFQMDVERGLLLNRLAIDNIINSLAYAPDGQTIAVGTESDRVQVWDKDGQFVTALEGGLGYGPSGVAFSADGSMLIADIHTERYQVESVQVWQTRDWSFLRAWELGNVIARNLILAPNGAAFATTTIEESAIRVWDILTGQNTRTWTFPQLGARTSVESIAFAPDSRQLASLSEEGDFFEAGDRQLWLRLWTLEQREPLYAQTIVPMNSRKGYFTSSLRYVIGWSPDGTLLAMGLPDGTVQVRQASDGGLLASLEGHTLWVTCVAFSPDGKMLASASLDGTVRIWAIR